MNEFLTAMEPYKDKFGLYHSKPVGPDGMPPTANGLLTTAQVYIINYLTYGYDNIDYGYGDMLDAILLCGVKPGLFKRSPVQDDQEGPDDYIGIASAFIDDGQFAKEIVRYGEDNSMKFLGIPLNYVYNNELPGTSLHKDGRTNWSAWFGRRPNVIAHLQRAAGRPVNLFRRLYWAINTAIAGHSDPYNETSYLLTWLQVQTFYKRGSNCFMGRLAVKYWWYRVHKQGLSMKQLYADYVADGGMHPMARFWEDFEQ